MMDHTLATHSAKYSFASTVDKAVDDYETLQVCRHGGKKGKGRQVKKLKQVIVISDGSDDDEKDAAAPATHKRRILDSSSEEEEDVDATPTRH